MWKQAENPLPKLDIMFADRTFRPRSVALIVDWQITDAHAGSDAQLWAQH